ncbi:serine/threonine protein kinase [Sphaeroforma arctica JP610]|uniref:Serine/threonine protein kinase n=1 Tax=Sphaeroforma arctica JP610 TaxID=667725 RepID=A0A0L0G9A4_9EUKA|nr:serine/threonine protein kinase [Sphaeroforma arctica JP610]KNC85471.1 serine/threonine protein kinase [Sphaeroforma arctica JP610]|eukprot:XP_014159373.1 serine/threonine protein kinase [Sphaeroforma arctica JP610]
MITTLKMEKRKAQQRMLLVRLPSLPFNVKRLLKRKRSSQTQTVALAVEELDITSCLNISRTSLHDIIKSHDCTDTVLPRSFSQCFVGQVPLTDGSTCTIYTATEATTGRQVALKKGDVFFDKFQMENEYQILTRLPKHSNIIEAYGLVVDAEHNEICVVLEMCTRGSLIDMILANPSGVENATFLPIALDLASACKEMHAYGIVHRDIKPDNVGVTENNGTKLLDFGEAVDLYNDVHVRLQAGSSRYMAPELIAASSHRNEDIPIHDCPLDLTKCDVWALGVTFYCLLTGSFPLHLASSRDPKYEEWASTGSFGPQSKWNTLTESEKILLINMLNPSPFNRWTMAETHYYLLHKRQPMLIYLLK